MGTQLNLNYLWFMLQGAGWSLLLGLIACTVGGLGGMLVALGRIAPNRPLRSVAALYIHLIEGTPILVLMFAMYFGLPGLGYDMPPLLAASCALVLNVSAFSGEIWATCLLAVPRAQWESATSLALTRRQRMVHVIAPQAVRIAIPPTVSFAVQAVKNTSLASVVGLVELARSGQIVSNSISEPFTVYLLMAALYFCLCYPLSRLGEVLERCTSPGLRLGPGSVRELCIVQATAS